MITVPTRRCACPGRADDGAGITVEGAAAASWAGLTAGEWPAGPALVIVTGSNA